jgi:excisionase family DNA binding protein
METLTARTRSIENNKMQLISRCEAAKLLSISVRTLDRIISDENRFTKYYIRGSVRLKLDELLDFIESST